MNRIRWIPFLLLGFLVGPPLALEAQPRFYGSMVLDSHGLRHLHVSVGQVYGLSAYQVNQVHPGWLYPEEVPVLHLIAREARVSPEVVLALREAGWSWWEISVHLRVRPRAFTAHLPYQPWVRGGYSDWEIVEWVNLGFWAQVYHRPVREVIVIRERVPTWTHVVYHYAPTVVVQAPPPAPALPPRAAPVAPGRAAPAPVTAPGRPAVPRAAPQAETSRTGPATSRTGPATSRTGPATASSTRAPTAAPVTRSPAAGAPNSAPVQVPRTPPPGGRAPTAAPAAPAPRAPVPPAVRSPAPPAAPPAVAPSPAPARTPARTPAAAPPATRAAPPPPAPAARGEGAERRPAVRPPSGSER
jgi:hypothetical protein